MRPLDLAKRRALRRQGQQGAALFVVAMTLAALASVGMYALAAASNEVKTSGYERQNTQTHFLSSYGVLGTAHEMMASKAQLYIGLMMTQSDAGAAGKICASVPQSAAGLTSMTTACRRLGSAELGAQWQGNILDAYPGTVPYQSGQTPGSLGPTPTQGDFFVEMTEPVKASAPARYAVNLNFCFVNLTVTSNGITRPLPANPNWTQTYGSESVEVQRARIIAGPIQCPR